MEAKQLAFFKDLLIQQRYEILNKADSFKEEAKESPVQGDEGDLAVSELNLALNMRLQERQAHLLSKVDRALAKIDEGTFGLCESCDEPLAIPRLMARPVANLCIACKEEQENKERVFA